MIRSLYVRTVLIFIVAVIISLAAAFVLAIHMYSNNVKSLAEGQIIAYGKKIIGELGEAPSESLATVMRNAVDLPGLRVKIMDENGRAVAYGDAGSGEQTPITAEQLDLVIHGGIYRGSVTYIRKHHNTASFLIGMPFQLDKRPHALFITPEIARLTETFRKFTLTVLGSVLLAGSLLILLAARDIVKPVQRLTDATRRMAKGDFGIMLQSKRKDEIGVLTESFNEMSGSLRQLDKLRTDFVNNVAHEIQSPLTSITGFSKALRTKTMTEEGRRHYLNIIEEESQRLSRLSANLLRLSVLQQDRELHHPGRFRLDEQIRRSVIACEPQWSAKGIEPELDLDGVTVYGDADSLEQVWHNLISNSIKFSDRGGTLAIKLRRHGEFAVAEVRDRGQGIGKDELQHIFTPFYKADSARDYAVKGNGLGLSIAKEIVDMHGGSIEAESEPGVQTSFTVRVPIEPKGGIV
ncbi:sensor histidine kinase [Paenibacillus sacheonensis]|uniref:Heme sensor protein HssS n=1 Tax=Paenibacillus sacheonensis TaxID=742054 RepID=A0A7X4YJE5_9BACL|nr:HAMP domain-containing sensor histidine kinase [Paenibacillus sacheonensis]MBM7564182.1 signal transduction histidine kinase [Paenibacillus sacheonensis]NBC67493.1 HAMP domain-containing protein [Paenibacillus sacheonensis]